VPPLAGGKGLVKVANLGTVDDPNGLFGFGDFNEGERLMYYQPPDLPVSKLVNRLENNSKACMALVLGILVGQRE